MSLIFSSMGVQKWRLLLSLHLIVQEEIKSNLAQQVIYEGNSRDMTTEVDFFQAPLPDSFQSDDEYASSI